MWNQRPPCSWRNPWPRPQPRVGGDWVHESSPSTCQPELSTQNHKSPLAPLQPIISIEKEVFISTNRSEGIGARKRRWRRAAAVRRRTGEKSAMERQSICGRWWLDTTRNMIGDEETSLPPAAVTSAVAGAAAGRCFSYPGREATDNCQIFLAVLRVGLRWSILRSLILRLQIVFAAELQKISVISESVSTFYIVHFCSITIEDNQHQCSTPIHHCPLHPTSAQFLRRAGDSFPCPIQTSDDVCNFLIPTLNFQAGVLKGSNSSIFSCTVD